MTQPYFFFLLTILVLGASTAWTAEEPCLDSAAALQEAIMTLPLDNAKYKTPELLLCPNIVVVLTKPLVITDRSVRLGCASSEEEGEPLCTLRGSEEEETRLVQVSVTARSKTTPTVQFSQIRFENGQSYQDQDSMDASAGVGGGIVSRGANLVLEDCRFIGNVASKEGGAISIVDEGIPILFLVTRTIFQDNLSIEQEDCHSINFRQDHPASMAELNTEADFGNSSSNRRLLDYWDDPAKAATSLRNYRPRAGATLCF